MTTQQNYIELNGDVKVKLTEHGEKVYKDHYLDLTIATNQQKVIIKDDQGFTSFKFWELCQIFGHSFEWGDDNTPFEDGKVYIR